MCRAGRRRWRPRTRPRNARPSAAGTERNGDEIDARAERRNDGALVRPGHVGARQGRPFLRQVLCLL